jgi:hypothetical protein
MKRDAIGWLVAGGLLACLVVVVQSGRPGRFQIVSVQDYPETVGGRGDVQPWTLRLDTVTGETRILFLIHGKPSDPTHWGVPVPLSERVFPK